MPHENGVYKAGVGAFSFPRDGIAYTENAPDWIDAATKYAVFEVELAVRPYKLNQTGPARIFTISQDHEHRNFTIGQSGRDLVVRLRTRATGSNGMPEYIIREVFGSSAPRHISVRVKPEEVRAEVDGHELLYASLPTRALSTWNPHYCVALGNEFTFRRPWHGEIRRAVVRVRPAGVVHRLSDLHTPEIYVPGMWLLTNELRESLLLPPGHVDLTDFIINVAGFVPLGLLIALVRRKRLSMPVACAWCVLVSLSIEIGQLFLEVRVFSIVDVLLNAAGGCIGVWLGFRIQPSPMRINGGQRREA